MKNEFKFCPECGIKLKIKGAKFCHECGQDLLGKVEFIPVPAPQTWPYIYPVVTTPDLPYGNYQITCGSASVKADSNTNTV